MCFDDDSAAWTHYLGMYESIRDQASDETSLPPERIEKADGFLKPTGSLYLHIDHTAHAYTKTLLDAVSGRKQFRNEIVWAYTGSSNTIRWFPRKHDILLFSVKSDAASFN